MKIGDYFESLRTGADARTPLVSNLQEPFTFWPRTTTTASFEAVHSSGMHLLDLYEVVSTELGYPVRIHYSYT